MVEYGRLVAIAVCSLGLVACGEDKLAGAPLSHTQDDGWSDSFEWEPSQPPPGSLPVPTSCQTGGLKGHLCVPGAPDALAAARVYLYAADCTGEVHLYATEATDNGYFALAAVPTGTHTLFIEHTLATTHVEVTVTPGVIRTAPAEAPPSPLCAGSGPPRVAVIAGDYDAVETVLDTIGVRYELYSDYPWSGAAGSEALELLSRRELMEQYDALFFNCGSLERDFLAASINGHDENVSITFDYTDPLYDNLRAFVRGGGNVYASDWAWPLAEGLAPEMLDFYSDDAQAQTVFTGVDAQLSGRINDPGLRSFIGSPTVPVEYDLDTWAVLQAASANATVFVSGDVTIIPELATRGPVRPPQDLAGVPLLVGYRPFAGGGKVVFTTFHYHAQPNARMLDVLRYLVFQL